MDGPHHQPRPACNSRQAKDHPHRLPARERSGNLLWLTACVLALGIAGSPIASMMLTDNDPSVAVLSFKSAGCQVLAASPFLVQRTVTANVA